MPDWIVSVPAETKIVQQFINSEREFILRDLADIRNIVVEALSSGPVYKIYGRDEKQSGESIKHPRKVRLKFNDFYMKQGSRRGTLWSVPDIIGLTVVVPYPSDISSVCEVIDGLILNGVLQNGDIGADSSEKSTAEKMIYTKYGRPLVSDGYFACHYNLRAKGVNSNRPQCEIQVKTILHDAWGAKTHDLTYKPSGKTSGDLISSFNLLGDTLAKIDEQSDLVRHSIERSAAPREYKKRLVRLATLKDVLVDSCKKAPMKDVMELLDASSTEPAKLDIKKFTQVLFGEFQKSPKECCYLFALRAVYSRKEVDRQQTLEALDAWIEMPRDNLEVIYASMIAGLISYCCGDMSSAIEYGEQTARDVELISRSGLDELDNTRLNRLENALYSSLSYYYAEMIGSHDGRLIHAHEMAIKYLDKTIPFRKLLGIPAGGLMAEDEQILEALSPVDAKVFARIFQTLENEAFVRIQTANTEIDVRTLRKKLELIYSKEPHKVISAADKFYDYHDYCARTRLAELECGNYYLPSSSNGKRI